MLYSKSAHTTSRWFFRLLIVGLLVTVAVFITMRGEQLLVRWPAMAVPTTVVPHTEQPRVRQAPLQAVPTVIPRSESPRVRQAPLHAVGEIAPTTDIPRDMPRRIVLGDPDGIVPNGTTLFDDELPGVANIDPALLAALREAAAAAADDWVEFYVTSGWRSSAYQEQLFREAIAEHGSEEEAARWVATAETSPHVSGDAVDIGSYDAMEWLAEHGAKYGLCQMYMNEPWHYELRPEAIEQGCPPMYIDPSHDPRMQQ